MKGYRTRYSAAFKAHVGYYHAQAGSEVFSEKAPEEAERIKRSFKK